MTIKDWPAAERPREKLLSRGLAALSDAELLAIVFGKGAVGIDAVQLAREVLSVTGGIGRLAALQRHQFTAFPGLGDAKFVALQAGIEIGRRTLRNQMERGSLINDAAAAKRFLIAELGHRTREAFCALFLDTRHRVIMFEILSLGTIDSAAVHPREVLKRVLEINAAAVIFAHNHPSGVCEPSTADAALTRTLCKALKLIDVTVLDHLVVAAGDIVSFADLGLLE